MRLLACVLVTLGIAVLAPTAAHPERRAQRSCTIEVRAGGIAVARSYYRDGSGFDSFKLSVPLVGPGPVAAQIRSNWSTWQVFKSRLSPPALYVPVTAGRPTRLVLRLSGADGQSDHAIERDGKAHFARIPLSDLDRAIGEGERAGIALIGIGEHGAETVAPGQEIDIAEYRKRFATLRTMQAILAGKAADPAGPCRNTESPRESVAMTYNCFRTWTNDRGSFGVYPGYLEWTRRIDDRLSLRWRWDSRSDGAAFDPRTWGASTLEALFNGISPADRLAMRIGDATKMHGAGMSGISGDLRLSTIKTPPEVTVYSGEVPIYNHLVPLDQLAAVQDELLAGYAAIVEDFRAPEGRCPIQREEANSNEIVPIS